MRSLEGLKGLRVAECWGHTAACGAWAQASGRAAPRRTAVARGVTLALLSEVIGPAVAQKQHVTGVAL